MYPLSSRHHVLTVFEAPCHVFTVAEAVSDLLSQRLYSLSLRLCLITKARGAVRALTTTARRPVRAVVLIVAEAVCILCRRGHHAFTIAEAEHRSV